MIFETLHRVLDPEPHHGAYNMAMDEALLRGATAPLLRVYGWSRPAVSFGYFGRWAELEPQWPGRELIRRWTGGGIVPHEADLTYTLVVPKGDALLEGPPGDSYRRIHEAVVRAMDGVDSGLTLSKGTAKVTEECFVNPAPHDVMDGGTKVAGAAQRRTRYGMLHQGSIQRAGLGEKFAGRLGGALAARVKTREISASEHAEADRLAQGKYGTTEWLRRF